MNDNQTDPTVRAVQGAASRLLVDEGPGALSVRRVAKAAGVSTMAVYSRFGGKGGLLDALRAEGFGVLAAAQARVAETADPLADLRGMVRIYRQVALTHRAHYALMFPLGGAEQGPLARPVGLGTFGALVARVERAVRAGLLEGPAPSVAMALFGLCHGLVVLEMGGARPMGDADAADAAGDGEAAYLTAVDALLRGFGAPG